MNNKSLLAGAGIGAAVAFMLDPARGSRRRAVIRDTVVSTVRKTRHGISNAAVDVAHRAQGLVAEVRGRLTEGRVDDDMLVERVRARLGHVIPHPRAIEVESASGEVTLRGTVPADGVGGLLAAIARVRGVRSVVNKLEGRVNSKRIPGLQAGGVAIRQSLGTWRPSARALVGAASLAATGLCVAAYARR
jgi:hypothetical protein